MPVAIFVRMAFWAFALYSVSVSLESVSEVVDDVASVAAPIVKGPGGLLIGVGIGLLLLLYFWGRIKKGVA